MLGCVSVYTRAISIFGSFSHIKILSPKQFLSDLCYWENSLIIFPEKTISNLFFHFTTFEWESFTWALDFYFWELNICNLMKKKEEKEWVCRHRAFSHRPKLICTELYNDDWGTQVVRETKPLAKFAAGIVISLSNIPTWTSLCSSKLGSFRNSE